MVGVRAVGSPLEICTRFKSQIAYQVFLSPILHFSEDNLSKSAGRVIYQEVSLVKLTES